MSVNVMLLRRFLNIKIQFMSQAIKCSTYQISKPLVTMCLSVNYFKPQSLDHYCISCKTSNILTKRYKSESKKKTQKDQDDENEEIWEENDKSLSRDSKILTTSVSSMRADVIIKAGLKVSRNKIETLFYESRMRLNGKKVLKKSARVNVGDEIDVVKMLSPKNPEHILVSRLEILKVEVEDDEIILTLRRFKSLLIENYEDPWKPPTESE